MMLLPALMLAHRRAVGWLLALGIGVGVGDIIDTFSHLHTPIEISVWRVVNGLVVGAIIGAIFVWIYRRFPSTSPQSEVAPR
jgi:NhaP-type Na+/H+ or K+/H+ antiporter